MPCNLGVEQPGDPSIFPRIVHRFWERSENASGGTADMYAAGKSDNLVVPTKRTNKARTLAAEFVEGRELPKRSDVPFMIAPDSEPDQAIQHEPTSTAGNDSIVTV
jgi:hypothetical protein